MKVVAIAIVAAAFVPFEFDKLLVGFVLNMVYEPMEIARVWLLLMPSELEVLTSASAQRGVEPIVLKRYQRFLLNIS